MAEGDEVEAQEYGVEAEGGGGVGTGSHMVSNSGYGARWHNPL